MACRRTSQRELILQELQQNSQHMSADELYGLVRKKMPKISLATVYRNLEFLVESGVIGRLESRGRQMLFDYDPGVHDHVTCVKCHRVENVSLAEEKENYPSHAMVDGYTITGCRIEFAGLCPRCQTEKQEKQGDETMGCGCACSCKKSELTDEQKQVLQAMANCVGACAAKDIAAATGLDAKVVSSRVTDLKKKGYVDSPERCRYGITEEGRAAIKN